MTAASPDLAALRASLQQRLEFARRVIGSDGALVAWQLPGGHPWLAADAGDRAAALATLEADLVAGRAGFDFGQRVLLAAGGHGVLLAREAAAPALCAALAATFAARLPGSALACAAVPFDPEANPEAEALALARLRRALRAAPDEAPPPALAPAAPAPPALAPSALPPSPPPGAQLVFAADPAPLTALADACHRLADHALAHAAAHALLQAAHAAPAALTAASPGLQPCFSAPPSALAAPAALQAALDAGLAEARWHLDLAEPALAALGALRFSWGAALGPARLGPERLAAAAQDLARLAAHRADARDHPGLALGALTPGAWARDGHPGAPHHLPLAALPALAAQAARLAALPAALRARLAPFAAAGPIDVNARLASQLRGRVAADPALWEALGGARDPAALLAALPHPAALLLAAHWSAS